MRALLTGGRGLVGTPLAARLAASGHAVHVADLPETDVTDAASVAAAFDAARPDVVVHLAAWTDVDGCEGDPERAEHVNAEGARLVAAAAAARGARVLYVSTDYVFDGRAAEPYVEEHPTAPLSAYGRSKLHGELAVRELVPAAWIVRCQSIYGRGKKSFADAILARARAGEPVRVVTDQVVSPSYAEDVADALAAVLRAAPPGTYHVANAGHCSWHEFACAVLAESGLGHVPVAPILAAELARPAPRPANSRFSCERLRAATGHVLRPWREALRAYLHERARVVSGGAS